jgi:phage shock protein E
VYCRSGRRSGIARETLIAQGFTNVTNIGGLQEALAKAEEAPIQ